MVSALRFPEPLVSVKYTPPSIELLRVPFAYLRALSSCILKVSFLFPIIVCLVKLTTAISSLKFFALSGLESNAPKPNILAPGFRATPAVPSELSFNAIATIPRTSKLDLASHSKSFFPLIRFRSKEIPNVSKKSSNCSALIP